jgi:hypothetical protein
MTMTWEDTQLVFPIYRERAIREQTCFCKCGCREAGVPPVSLFGHPEPGICAACKKARNWRMHERAVSAASIYRDPEDEAEEPQPDPQPVSADERDDAVAYVLDYGEGGTALIERLRERLEKGQPLTDTQVRSALRSKAADERYASRVLKRADSRSEVRVSIPKDVRSGYYAVSDGSGGWVFIKLARPSRGPRQGWTVVSASATMTLVEVGSQRPHRLLDTLLQTAPPYRGKMTRAIATLIGNPTKARADYKELTGG